MRTLLTQAAFAFAAIAAVASRSAAESPPAANDDVRLELADPLNDPQAAAVQRVAAVATNFLGQKLIGEITVALKFGTPEDAVAAAHLHAVSVDGQAVPDMPKIKEFKLTSQRLINAANYPDHAEQQVLEEVARSLRLGTKPAELFVQRIALPDGTEQWRGYRPLAVLPACLTCHGPTEGKSPRLRSLLTEHATSTPATGYKVGEWRGLMRVTVETPPAPAAAPAGLVRADHP